MWQRRGTTTEDKLSQHNTILSVIREGGENGGWGGAGNSVAEERDYH